MTNAIKGLGEIALRVADLERMQEFYATTVGLELLRRFPTIAFFRIADGVAGHTQVLALFDRSGEPDDRVPSSAQTTVDHLAFGIECKDFAAQKARLEGLGVTVTTAEHAWIHWRSLYFADPEGNTIELVCYDAAV
jgi:catechol 2,3-dioxygenase-like lactoylglutathione lyase family enzyme